MFVKIYNKNLIKKTWINNYSFLITAILFLILPNIIFWFVNAYFHAIRPLFVSEYLLVLLAFLIPNNFFKILFSGIILFAVFSLDCVLWVRQYFPFMRLGDAIFLLKLIKDGPALYSYLVILATVIFIGELFLLVKLLGKKSPLGILKIGFICGIFLFILSSFNQEFSKNNDINRYQIQGIARSYILYLHSFKDNFLYNELSWTPKIMPSPYQGVTQLLWDDLSQSRNSSSHILLIVNESWGKSIDSDIEKEVLQNVLSQKNHLSDLRLGELPFVGATVDAELRELCKIKTTNFNLKGLSTGFENCLPNLLEKKGYQTYGMHGANSSVYDRGDWYKKAGLTNTTFFENLQNPSLCYSFSGACDDQLLSLIDKSFGNNKDNKLFYYWMTLNTHYPYDRRDLKNDRFNCDNHNLTDDSEECRNLKLQTQFFDGLATLISSPNLKGTEVYVVGDHTPPLLKPIQNFRVFKENTVSYMHFIIN